MIKPFSKLLETSNVMVVCTILMKNSIVRFFFNKQNGLANC